jgi:hypothetical protein
MTYKQLKDFLNSNVLTKNQLEMDITVYFVKQNEYYPVYSICITHTDSSVLDITHPYLTID